MNLKHRLRKIMPVPISTFYKKNDDVQKELDIIKEHNARLEEKLNDISMNIDKVIDNSEFTKRLIHNKFNSAAEAKKRTTPLVMLNFVYHLADHCNLNCKGCDHFSPIAEAKLADLDSFKKDIKRLGELCGGVAKRVNLQGGEPLLHPLAIEFAVFARECFPIGQILFTTNGLLLEKQDEVFWKKCAQYNISIEITKYPINLNYENINELAQKYGVSCEFYGSSDITEKTSYFIPLDLTGKQDVIPNFEKCFHANNCIMLKEGRMYTCTVAANIEHFNRYYGTSVELSEQDSIDIHSVESLNEITEFLAKPIPFCRYCNVNGREFGHTWGQSKKEISEWLK